MPIVHALKLDSLSEKNRILYPQIQQINSVWISDLNFKALQFFSKGEYFCSLTVRKSFFFKKDFISLFLERGEGREEERERNIDV